MTSGSGSSAIASAPTAAATRAASSGEEIALEARILAVTDAYVAMTSDRPYRLTRSHEDACRELSRCAGTQFDGLGRARLFCAHRKRRNPHLARAAA